MKNNCFIIGFGLPRTEEGSLMSKLLFDLKRLRPSLPTIEERVSEIGLALIDKFGC